MDMAASSFELCEFFHLTVLRHLALRLSGRAYAVKGGICLRFFHRSGRLSHDMDLDVLAQVRVKTLQGIVDSVLQSHALTAALGTRGIRNIQTTRPKQTDTTQRWKVALRSSDDVETHTKIEFSRRRAKLDCCRGVPDAELLRNYAIVPFAVQFYGVADMVEQKIRALCALSLHAARDLFDLHHLLTFCALEPETVSSIVDAKTVEQAIEKAGAFSLKDFRAQVTPYLTESMQSLYDNADAFDKLKDVVEQALTRMIP